jgi:hypothetical protein
VRAFGDSQESHRKWCSEPGLQVQCGGATRQARGLSFADSTLCRIVNASEKRLKAQRHLRVNTGIARVMHCETRKGLAHSHTPISLRVSVRYPRRPQGEDGSGEDEAARVTRNRRRSAEGGQEAVWARGGRELYRRSGDKMMVAEFDAKSSSPPGKPRVLFDDRDMCPASWRWRNTTSPVTADL